MIENYFYLLEGQKDNPPLMFLHGFLGSSADWSTIIQELKNDYFILVPDLPGHGKTKVHHQKSDYKMSSVAKNLNQYLKQCNIQAVQLIGYSMGGRLALYLTVHYPDLIKKLIIVSASAGLKTAEELLLRQKWEKEWIQYLTHYSMSEFVSKWYQQPIFHSLHSSKNIQQIIQRRMKNENHELISSLQHMGTGQQESLWPYLNSIKIPVHMIVGDLDSKYVDLSQHMGNCIPNSYNHIVRNCGHNVYAEKPEEFNQLLKDILNESN